MPRKLTLQRHSAQIPLPLGPLYFYRCPIPNSYYLLSEQPGCERVNKRAESCPCYNQCCVISSSLDASYNLKPKKMLSDFYIATITVGGARAVADSHIEVANS